MKGHYATVMSVCLSVCLFISLFVCLSVAPATYLQPCHIVAATKGVPYVFSPLKNSPPMKFMVVAGAYSWRP